MVTAVWHGMQHAMTATAFCSVSLDPPLVLVSVGHTSRFHAAILGAGAWAVSFLAADQQPVAQRFALHGRDLASQFDDLPCWPGPETGSPLIAGALSWVECQTYATHEAGDHTLVVGLVLRAGPSDDIVRTAHPGPLTYYRGSYHYGPPSEAPPE